jgi:hypothetical protein
MCGFIRRELITGLAILETLPLIAIHERRHHGASMRGAIMASFPFRIGAVAVTFALFAAQVPAYAQSEVPMRDSPQRNANVWDWRDHQPTEGGVSRKEKAAGIAPTPAENLSNSATADKIYQQLMHQPPG